MSERLRVTSGPIRREDLSLRISGGLVVHGPVYDWLTLMRFIRTKTKLQIVYDKSGNDRLYLVTEKEFNLLKDLKEGRLRR